MGCAEMRRPPSNKKSRRGGSRPGRPANAWQRSGTFKSIAREALRQFRAVRHLRPKCGASAKTTGEPCKQLAMENGRCAYHGGRTPKGDDWHVMQLPTKSAPKSNAKAHAKIIRSQKSARARGRHLAALSSDERNKLGEWTRAHRPGSAAARRRDREYRRQAKDAKALIAAVMARPAPPLSPEAQALDDRIAELKAQLEVIAAERETDRGIPVPPDDEADDANPGADANLRIGVFS